MSNSLNELKDLIIDSTVHGVPKLFKSKSILMKIVWAVFTTASVLLCAHQIKQSLGDFLAYNTVSTFENRVEIPAKFPAITFCNQNILQTNFKSKLTKH